MTMIICNHCGNKWDYKGQSVHPTCSKCGLKVWNPEPEKTIVEPKPEVVPEKSNAPYKGPETVCRKYESTGDAKKDIKKS